MTFDTKIWYQKNREEIRKKHKDYYQKNKERQKAYQKSYKEKNKERIKSYRQLLEVKAKRKEYLQKNKEKIKKQQKGYYQRDGVKIRMRSYYKKYNQENKDKLFIRIKKYVKANRERINDYQKKYMQKPEVKFKKNKRRRNRKKIDYDYYLTEKLRTFIWSALKSYSITGKIKPSCEYGVDYKAVIENLKPFPKDIQNYHVDHIIPLSIWDFNNPEHIKKAFSPENHQWLTPYQNMWKSNRLVSPCFVETIK